MQPADLAPIPGTPSTNPFEHASRQMAFQSSGDTTTDVPSQPIPIFEEQVQIDRKVIETGQVRLIKTVEETDELVTTTLNQEEFVVERVPIDQYVDLAPTARQEGETTIYPVLREVLVVEKRLLLVEEVRVTRRLTQQIDEQTVTLRREAISVERNPLSDERSA